MNELNVVLLFSGKRKSGKDYIAEKLFTIYGQEKSRILRISEPIKYHYAKANGLDLKELMSDNPYKENYRQGMIVWSDEIRKAKPGYFCNAACTNVELKPVWIVSDVRRKTDIEWFKNKFDPKVKTIRIFTDDEVRAKRGWKFTQDDVASECDLDDYTDWDLKIHNNGQELVDEEIKKLLNLITPTHLYM